MRETGEGKFMRHLGRDSFLGIGDFTTPQNRQPERNNLFRKARTYEIFNPLVHQRHEALPPLPPPTSVSPSCVLFLSDHNILKPDNNNNTVTITMRLFGRDSFLKDGEIKFFFFFFFFFFF